MDARRGRLDSPKRSGCGGWRAGWQARGLSFQAVPDHETGPESRASAREVIARPEPWQGAPSRLRSAAGQRRVTRLLAALQAPTARLRWTSARTASAMLDASTRGPHSSENREDGQVEARPRGPPTRLRGRAGIGPRAGTSARPTRRARSGRPRSHRATSTEASRVRTECVRAPSDTKSTSVKQTARTCPECLTLERKHGLAPTLSCSSSSGQLARLVGEAAPAGEHDS